MRKPEFGWPWDYKYAIFFLITIAITRALASYVENFLYKPSSTVIDNSFASGFVEWFGVIYGLLLPLILVRVWEQLDVIDREFDREADTIGILYQDLAFLHTKDINIRTRITNLLRDYVRHTVKFYPSEVKEAKTERRAGKYKSEEEGNSKIYRGDEILLSIRKQFEHLVTAAFMRTKDSEFIVTELFQRLNEIIDIRGDRIGFASQRLFETLRHVALITSILFIVPFYIVGFRPDTSILDHVLIIGVTWLVIFMYMLIEDFDEPFGGTWKISIDSWVRVRKTIVCNERKLQTEKLNRSHQLTKNSRSRSSSTTRTQSGKKRTK